MNGWGPPMKVLDLFSGIGGFSLGLEWAGMETIAMCEKDAFCRQILAKHWPDIPIHEDIRSLDGSQYKSVDVICGGFPCQPYSQAGRQLGNKDDRDLWSEMFRIIQESCPTWVIGENVSGFIGMALDDVCADLEDEGYQVQSFVIPACAVEARHRRDRCWIVAHADENDWRRGDCTISQDGRSRVEHRSGSEGQSFGQSNTAMADTTGERVQGLWTGGEQESYAHAQSLVPLCEGQEPTPTNWQVEPCVDRVVDGLPNRVDRIKSLGNAVVPQLVQRIGEIIYANHINHYGEA